MKRRDFIKKAAVGAAAGTAITGAPFVHAAKTVHWRMATSRTIGRKNPIGEG